MPRIADALERESRTVDLEQGDFERLLGRRERKQRNRRIRAGVVGVAVALVMGLAFVRSLTSDGIPADPPVEPRRHRRRRHRAPSPTNSTATSTWPTRTARTRSRSRTAFPTARAAPTIPTGGPTERRDRCGHRTGGTSPFATGTAPTRKLEGGVISDAEGNVLATFPREGWEIAWSPDSTRVAVWDVTFETIGVYGLDGARRAQLTMPPGWTPSGDHDPKWMPDGTSVWVENWELPLDGSAPRELPVARGRSVCHLLARRIARRVQHQRITDGCAVRRLRTSRGVRRGVVRGRLGPPMVRDRRSDRVRDERPRQCMVVRRTARRRCSNRLGDTADRRGAWSEPPRHRVLTAGRPHPFPEGRGPREFVVEHRRRRFRRPPRRRRDVARGVARAMERRRHPSGSACRAATRGRSLGSARARAGSGRSWRGPYVMSRDLVAQDPGSGAVRTIVDADALPGGCSQECSFGDSDAITGAAWSPDRRWVAFRAGGLWVADTIGGAPRQLTADQGWSPWVWSPTENRLAVVQGRRCDPRRRDDRA